MEIFLLHVQYGVTKWNQISRGLLAVTSQDVTWRYEGRLREAASICSLATNFEVQAYIQNI
jgi:hypothetical protein